MCLFPLGIGVFVYYACCRRKGKVKFKIGTSKSGNRIHGDDYGGHFGGYGGDDGGDGGGCDGGGDGGGGD